MHNILDDLILPAGFEKMPELMIKTLEAMPMKLPEDANKDFCFGVCWILHHTEKLFKGESIEMQNR